jgi:hypothetical protein
VNTNAASRFLDSFGVSLLFAGFLIAFIAAFLRMVVADASQLDDAGRLSVLAAVPEGTAATVAWQCFDLSGFEDVYEMDAKHPVSALLVAGERKSFENAGKSDAES